jgi:hypothetical protein
MSEKEVISPEIQDADTGTTSNVEEKLTSETTETQETKETQTWQEQYLKDTEFYDNPSLKTIPDVPTLVKNHINALALVGKKGVLPKEDATPEERDKVLDELANNLGRPEAPDKYAIDRPEMPPGLPYIEPMETDFRATAYKLRLTQDQTKGMYDWFMEYNIGSYVSQQNARIEEHNKVVDQFKKELGEEYDAKIQLAEKTMTDAGGQELRDYLDTTGLGSHPAMVKAWLKVASMISEGAFVDGGGFVSQTKLDELTELNRHPALLDSNWKGGSDDKYKTRKEVLKRRDELFKEVYQGETRTN